MPGEADVIQAIWRTIKYEEVYLRAYAGVCEARASIGRYLGFYNGRRPHSSLDGKTPDQACFNAQTPEAAAASTRRKATWERPAVAQANRAN